MSGLVWSGLEERGDDVNGLVRGREGGRGCGRCVCF